MFYYTTIIRAIDPITGQMKTWAGPNIRAISHNSAVQYCRENGLGYCEIDGLLVSEIHTKADGITPDMDNKDGYDVFQLN